MPRNVFIDLIGRDNASPAFNSAGAAAERNAKRINTLTKSFATGAAQLGLAVGGYELVKKAIDIGKEASAFQSDMVKIQTQAGASAKEVKAFTQPLLDMSGKVAQGPEDLALSLYHVYSATKTLGYSGPQMLNAVKIAAEGATASGADLEETTNALTATMASGLGHVSNMAGAMGSLNAIVGAGDMKMSDLNEALSTGILATVQSFNVTLPQAGAALALFGDHNIRGAEAATKLRMAVMDLSKPAAHADEVLGKVGLTTTSLRNDLEKGGLTLALHHLRDSMRAAGISSKQTGGFIEDAFTKKSGAGLTILLNRLNQYDQKQRQIQIGAKNFGAAWEATTHTASFAWKSFGDAVDAAGVSVALKMMPALEQAGSYLGQELPTAISVLTGVLDGPLSAAWTATTTAFSLIGDVLSPILSVLNDIKGPLGDVAELVLGVWIAFKLGAAIPAILDGIALRAMYLGDSMVAMKVKAVTALTTTAAAADATASEVAIAGGVASTGWRAMLGPLAAVGVGIGILVSMFHHSSSASKEATDAAKAYTDALSSSSDGADLTSTITARLGDNNVPQEIDDLNKALGKTAFTGPQFVDAINKGGNALKTLEGRLWAVQRAQTFQTGAGTMIKQLTPQAIAAGKLLRSLADESDGMSAALKKDVANFQQFGVVAAPIADVARKLNLTSDQVKTYASLLGMAVTKSGALVDATDANRASILSVGKAFATATASGAAFVQAWGQFASSQGTAADRAALIGATLKAANGDALGFAGAMNAAATATQGLGSGIASAAKSAKTSVSAYMASIVNLSSGTIHYNKAAAAPLISALSGIQSAAMSAASATYQHFRAQMSGKDAADAAYKVYVSKTRGALISEASQLGITSTQAGKLADKYFGMPGKVKTLIESEGQDKIYDVLTKIGKLLADFVGKPWNATIAADATKAKKAADDAHNKWISTASDISRLQPTLGVDDTYAITSLSNVHDLWDSLHNKSITLSVTTYGVAKASSSGNVSVAGAPTHADGGWLRGPGTGTSDSILARVSNGEYVIRASQARKHGALLDRINTPGFASGGSVDTSGVTGSIGNVGSAYSTPINVASTGINRILGQLAKAGDALNKAIAKGLGSAAASAFRSQIEALREEAERQLKALKHKIVTTDVSALSSALTLTRTETEAAMNSLIADAKHAGASDGLIDKLVGKENKLLSLQKQRNTVAKSISAEQAKLNSLQSKYADVYNSTKSASVGTFDITTAGQTDATASTFGDMPGTAASTSAGSILSSLKATAANAAKFGAVLKKLIKAGLNKTLVLQLAQAGPAALAQAQALAAATPAQMKSLNSSYSALDSASSQIGKLTATNMYGAGIASAQGLIKGLQSKESVLNKQMQKLAKSMVTALKDALGIHSPSRVMRGLAHNTAEGYRLGLVDRLEHVAKAGKDLGNAGVPDGQPGQWQAQPFGGRGGNEHHWHIKEVADPAAIAAAVDRRVQFGARP